MGKYTKPGYGPSVTERKNPQEHKERRWTRADFYGLGLNFPRLLPSLTLSVSLSPSFLSTFVQYIFFCTSTFHLSLFCPSEGVSSTHSRPKMICMQKSYVQGPQGPQGLTQGIRDVSWENGVPEGVNACGRRSSPSEHWGWLVYLPHVESFTSWPY